MAAAADRYREDTLWTKVRRNFFYYQLTLTSLTNTKTQYREIKNVLEGPAAGPSSGLRTAPPRVVTGFESSFSFPGPPLSGPRFDDSGRLVDMSEVRQNLFIGSE